MTTTIGLVSTRSHRLLFPTLYTEGFRPKSIDADVAYLVQRREIGRRHWEVCLEDL